MVDAVLFDVNETVFGLDPLERRMTAAGLPSGSRERWFAAVLIDGLAAAAAGSSVAFTDLADHHARRLLAAEGLSVTDTAVASILDGFGEVVPHDDVGPAFRWLRGAGVTVATFTNGTATVTGAALERGGIRELVDHVWDVSAAGHWKPRAEAYRWACAQLGLPVQRVALVAVHPWDVNGAQRAGLRGGLVVRAGDVGPRPGYLAPDAVADDLVTVCHGLVDI